MKRNQLSCEFEEYMDGMPLMCGYPAKYIVYYERDGNVQKKGVCKRCFAKLVLKLVHRGYKVWKEDVK